MTIVGTLPFQLQNGTTADATQVMADFNKIVNDTNANAAGNGVNTDITALAALVTPITPAQGGTNVYFASTSSGTANAQIVATPTPSGFTLAIGKRVVFTAGFTNTGAMTLNVNSTGATNVFRQTPAGPVALTGGEVVLNNRIEVEFDGTQFVLFNSAAGINTGPLTTLASAATTELGSIPSHNVSITGTATITAFGSTAVVTYPLYQLKFTGAATLTHNATSLILPGSANIVTAANDTALALYLGSGNWQVLVYNKANGQALAFNPTFLQGYINGLTLNSVGTSATFGIAAGEATDSTNASAMLLASAYTKTTASWAVGSGNGSLDTGAIAINTWYHVFLIQRPDTGVVDVLVSLSATAPTMPTNYTLFRRIGSMKTNGSSQWTPFTQVGDEFLWDVPVQDQNSSGTPTGAYALTVPSGVTVMARMNVLLASTLAGATVLVQAGIGSGQSAGTPATNITMSTQVASVNMFAQVNAMTNTSRQIVASSNGSGTIQFGITTYGWRDNRGKL